MSVSIGVALSLSLSLSSPSSSWSESSVLLSLSAVSSFVTSFSKDCHSSAVPWLHAYFLTRRKTRRKACREISQMSSDSSEGKLSNNYLHNQVQNVRKASYTVKSPLESPQLFNSECKRINKSVVIWGIVLSKHQKLWIKCLQSVDQRDEKMTYPKMYFITG
jgi:hypothetical protein